MPVALSRYPGSLPPEPPTAEAGRESAVCWWHTIGGGDAVRNPTYAGRKIFLLSPRCPKRCAGQVSGCGRGEHVALASSWGLPVLWEEIRELAGFAVAFEQPYVMGGTSGDGQARYGARATTCYGMSSGRWRGPLWRSSFRP